MEDQKVSFETAKLAKEKGFDVDVRSFYTEYHKTNKSDNPAFCTKEGEIEVESGYFVNNGIGELSNENYTCYARPTQSLLRRWLFEKHNIDVLPFKTYSKSRLGECYECKYNDGGLILTTNFDSETYEDGLEKGLQEALKLLNTW